jgi:F-type H+-transporting ATPase subunit b
VLNVVVTRTGTPQFEVVVGRLPRADDGKAYDVERKEDCEFDPQPVEGGFKCGEGPSPILPEMKELVWGGGAFLVFAILMRLVLYPRLKRGVDAREATIQQGHDDAASLRSAAQGEVAAYEAGVAAAKAEANAILEEARATLEAERSAALAEANARIAERRAAAATAAEAARTAVRDQIEAAIADVSGAAVEKSTGKRPDAESVRRAVTDAMATGVGR